MKKRMMARRIFFVDMRPILGQSTGCRNKKNKEKSAGIPAAEYGGLLDRFEIPHTVVGAHGAIRPRCSRER